MYKLLIVNSIDELAPALVKDRLGRTVELTNLDFAKKCASIAESKHGPIQVVLDTNAGYVLVVD